MFSNYDLTEFVVEKLYENLSGRISKHGKNYQFSCPFCGDSKKSSRKQRGWFYTNTNSYYCFNCDKWSSSFELLNKLTNKSITEIKKELLKRKSKFPSINLNLSNTKNFEVNAITTHREIVFETPIYTIVGPDWEELKETSDDYLLLKSRKIFEAPFLPKGWRAYHSKKFNRLIIPWIENNKIIYYQYRKLYKDQEPKYLFPKDTDKPLHIVNFDPKFPYLFILEGILDAFFCKNSACIGGKKATKLQLELLNKYKDQGISIVWLLDNQWTDKSGKEESIKLVKEGNSIFLWPKEFKSKDINDHILSNSNPFLNSEFLTSHIVSGPKALLQLTWN